MGNYIAEQVIAFGLQDGANEAFDYVNLYYEPLNEQLVVSDPGNPTIADPNRWQPLAIGGFVDQSGQVLDSSPPVPKPRVGLGRSLRSGRTTRLVIYERDGELWPTYGSIPVRRSTSGATNPLQSDSMFRHHFAMVSIWQSHHDPYNGVMVDASPSQHRQCA